jgi:Prenyltransferase and squalene oxidase repeat
MPNKLLSTAAALTTTICFLSAFTASHNPAPLISTSTIRAAAAKGLALLEQSGYQFTTRSAAKCASCHHNSLTSMAAAIARQKAVPVIDSFTRHRIVATERSLKAACNLNLINSFLVVNFAQPYFLIALNADRFEPNFTTDITVDYLISQALPDGRFQAETGRIPLEAGDIHLTAIAIRAIQLYASPAKTQKVAQLVAKTRTWLETTHPDQQQELAFKLLGLQWCGSSAEEKTKVSAAILGMQNADGGWAQLPTLGSDAYATGQNLYALFESGTLKPEDPAYQKALAYLLKTQDADGAWIVTTRAYPIQPFFNSDFPPYDENQFISATASNWSVMALLNALPDTRPPSP